MDSVAFELFGFQVYWYGILTAVGFILAFSTASRRAPLVGIQGEAIVNLTPWIIVGAVIGARALYVVTYWDKEFAGQPMTRIFNMRSGLVYYGGLIGASLATILYSRKNRLPLWRVADVMAPSIALGHAFGRVGCFMTGCCYGVPTTLPWAVHFPKDHETGGAGVHPTQLYESGLNLALYAVLAWLYRNRKFEGQVFAVYLLCYAVLRAAVETMRGDYEPRYYFGGLTTPGQTVSILIMAAGVALWIKQRNSRVAAADRGPQ